MEKENNPLSKVDLMHHLLNKGTICYLPDPFDHMFLVDKIMDWLLTNLNLEAQYTKEEELHLIDYKKKGGMAGTLGLAMSYKLFMLVQPQKLYFDIKPSTWFENQDKKLSISKMVSESHETDVKNFIFQYLYLQYSSAVKFKMDTRNHFIEKINEQKKVWFCTQFLPDEQLLVFLEISAIKQDNGKLNQDKTLKWYIYFSTTQSGLVAFDGREQAVQIVDIDTGSFKVKNEIGRNPVYFTDFKLLTNRSNADLFFHIQQVCRLDPIAKVREIARLNWLYQEKNDTSNQFAIALQHSILEKTNDTFDELSLIFMEYTAGDREKVFASYTQDEKLAGLLQKLLNNADTYEQLTQWIQKWDVSYIDMVAMNNMLLKAIENAVQANNILPFHRFVREKFFSRNNDVLNEILFDIEFSKHLIKCGLGKEAKKILQKRLEQLPDESISDLLPAKDIDLTGNAAGQILKVSILEILSGLETEKESAAIKCQVARLQPLVDEKIDQLIAVQETRLSTKGKEIKNLMIPEGLVVSESKNETIKYKMLDAGMMEKLIRHPASRKNGSFSNFQKWLATVKIPDLSMLKSYTEKLSAQKHPELNTIVADIKYALNLENLEVYISHGDKSVGLTCFESDPNFLIVGGDHLEKTSPNYLNNNELRFAIGSEMAHLYFKHARITSSDIWKGAFEKGYFVVDTILSVFPAVGMFSKSLQTIGRLNQISSFLQKTEKIGKVTSQSRDILKNSEQVVNVYKSKFTDTKKENTKENEMLATARIMQLTAHRCALMFAKDLKSAIRAMFLVSRRYYSDLPVIEKYGLRDYLLKKDENGNFCHQELAIRLADLCSFYLSDEYEKAVKILEG